MENKNIILIAIIALVIIIAIIGVFSLNSNSDLNSNTTSNNTTNKTNITDKSLNNQSKGNVNAAGSNVSNEKNISHKNSGWKWSEQQQGYVNEYVDSQGNLHVQTTDGKGSFQELEYRADGKIYNNGKDVTKQYHEDFN